LSVESREKNKVGSRSQAILKGIPLFSQRKLKRIRAGDTRTVRRERKFLKTQRH